MAKRKAKRKDNILGRFDIMSIVVLVGADLVAWPSDMTGIGIITLSLLIALVAGILIFLNEWFVSGKFSESLVDGFIMAFLVAIPLPVVGVLTGAVSLLSYISKKGL